MLDREWLSTFAPVGLIPAPGQWQPTGAGVFIRHHDLVWLATAHHVAPQDGGGFGILAPVNGQPTLFELTEIMAHTPDASWIADSAHDVAVAPMPTPPGIGIKAISRAQTLRVQDVLPSMTCLTGGCPYGLPGMNREKSIPIVLDGVIAGTDTASRTLFISTPTFPGNSGGPIIVVRSPFNPAGGMVVGRPTILLAGIVSQFQTIQPNDPKAAPLRLGVGVAIDVVFDLLDGSKATSMARSLKSRA